MFVYIAKFVDCDFLKIGWSNNCLKRLNEMGADFEYYYSVKLKNENQARLFESLLHDAFREKRVPPVMINVVLDGRTEFFTPCVLQDISQICKLLGLELVKNKEPRYIKTKKHATFNTDNKDKFKYFIDGCIYALSSVYILKDSDINEIKEHITKGLSKQCTPALFEVLDNKNRIR